MSDVYDDAAKELHSWFSEKLKDAGVLGTIPKDMLTQGPYSLAAIREVVSTGTQFGITVAQSIEVIKEVMQKRIEEAVLQLREVEKTTEKEPIKMDKKYEEAATELQQWLKSEACGEGLQFREDVFTSGLYSVASLARLLEISQKIGITDIETAVAIAKPSLKESLKIVAQAASLSDVELALQARELRRWLVQKLRERMGHGCDLTVLDKSGLSLETIEKRLRATLASGISLEVQIPEIKRIFLETWPDEPEDPEIEKVIDEILKETEAIGAKEIPIPITPNPDYSEERAIIRPFLRQGKAKGQSLDELKRQILEPTGSLLRSLGNSIRNSRN